MKSYRLCFISPEGRIDIAHAITCADDFDAFAQAERLCENHMIEVWQGDRRVAQVNKHTRPLTTQDYQSL